MPSLFIAVIAFLNVLKIHGNREGASLCKNGMIKCPGENESENLSRPSGSGARLIFTGNKNSDSLGWPYGVVLYNINEDGYDPSDVSNIQIAMRTITISTNSCIQFVHHTPMKVFRLPQYHLQIRKPKVPRCNKRNIGLMAGSRKNSHRNFQVLPIDLKSCGQRNPVKYILEKLINILGFYRQRNSTHENVEYGTSEGEFVNADDAKKIVSVYGGDCRICYEGPKCHQFKEDELFYED